MQGLLARMGPFNQALKLFLTYVVLVSIAVIMGGPFLWMVLTAIKPAEEVFVYPPKLIPSRLSLENVQEVMDIIPIFRYLYNSFCVSLVGTVGQLVVCAMAAFSFARLRYPGRDQLFLLLLCTMMIPGAVTLIPSFLIVKFFGWMDSYEALIIPGLSSAFATFLLRQFFLTIPNELEDAARIDGAGRLRFFVAILLPLSVPALITLGIFGFLGQWNSFLWPLLILRTKEKFLIQIGLSHFASEWLVRANLQLTAATISVLPLLIVFIVGQRYFVRGVILSGIKG